MKRALVLVLLAAALVPAPWAAADHHSMKVREVFAGTNADQGLDFVELQMYQGGQHRVMNARLRVFDAAGAQTHDVVLPSDVGNGESQRSILIGDTVDGITPDFPTELTLDGAGGRACFLRKDNQAVIDCVTWGTYLGSTTDHAPQIPLDSSITRSITPGCPTALEESDDTDNDFTDFSVTSPSPTSNPSLPTDTGCGGGGGGGEPDLAPPVSTIDRPRQGKTYAPSKLRTLRGTATDNGVVAEVELALRKKLVSGACRWWNGSGFVKRACGSKLFFDAGGTGSWSSHLPSKLARSVGTTVAAYTLYARSRDAAGNIEPLFTKGRNANRFEIGG